MKNKERIPVMRFEYDRDFNGMIRDIIIDMDKNEGGILESEKTALVASESDRLYLVSVKVTDARAEMVLQSGIDTGEE